MLTLWDLIEPARARRRRKREEELARAAEGSHGQVLAPVKDRGSGNRQALTPIAAEPRALQDGPGGCGGRGERHRRDACATGADTPLTMAERYEALTRAMLKEHGVRVRKWRTSMSGVAWQVRYADGTIARLIESPRPKGPMSAAIFLHEIGHHAIGFNVYRPRCLEEYHAWAWSLAQMERHGLNITDAVRRRMHESLWYAVEKAKRRGLREVPAELAGFEVRRVGRRNV